jgi:hypothetical protein
MYSFVALDILAGIIASLAGSFIYSHLITGHLISLDTFLFSSTVTILFSLFSGPRIRSYEG